MSRGPRLERGPSGTTSRVDLGWVRAQCRHSPGWLQQHEALGAPLDETRRLGATGKGATTRRYTPGLSASATPAPPPRFSVASLTAMAAGFSAPVSTTTLAVDVDVWRL